MGFLYSFLSILLEVLSWAIIGRVLISWFDPRFSNPISRFLRDITEPILAPIRSIMPSTGMLDLSPMVALVLIWVLKFVLDSTVF